MARQVYAIPHEWTEKLGIRRYGFHGASHRYIATRVGRIGAADERCAGSFQLPSRRVLLDLRHRRRQERGEQFRDDRAVRRAAQQSLSAILIPSPCSKLIKHGYTLDG
jgi:hypothetical protein